MKKSVIYYMVLSIVVSVFMACGGSQNSSSIDQYFLLKNKFLGTSATLTFENETNYNIAGSMSGCSWSNEGTYVIDGDKILLTPTKCVNECDEKSDPCKSTVGEGVCTLIEKNGMKFMFVKASYEGFSEDYVVVDKLNPCEALKKDQANVVDGPTELDGKWISVSDTAYTIEYKDAKYTSFNSGQMDGEGEYKISNIYMISECFYEQNIKSLKSGKFLSESYFDGMNCNDYKIEGEVLYIN